MKTVIIKDNTRTGKQILAFLRRHPRTAIIVEQNNDNMDIPTGYVSHKDFWEEADKQLLKAYGKS